MPDKVKTLKGVYIGDTFKIVEVKDDIHEFYKLLDVECIDIVSTTVNGIPVDIVCDDEALLKSDPVPHAVNSDGRACLFGKLLVVGIADSKGDLTSLTDEQCTKVLHSAGLIEIHKTECRLVLRTTYGDECEG